MTIRLNDKLKIVEFNYGIFFIYWIFLEIKRETDLLIFGGGTVIVQ